jgi:hypothetical protein
MLRTQILTSAIRPLTSDLFFLVGGLEQSLLGFFLALDAVASPGHGLQSLGIDFLTAGNTLSKRAFAQPGKRAVHHQQKLPIIVALAEEKFFGIRTGRAVGNVLSCLVVGAAPILLVAGHHVAEFFLPRLQLFSEIL